MNELVELIRANGNASKLLEQHAATQDGRCRTCKAGGGSTGRVLFPCNIWLAARAAVDRPGPDSSE